MKNKFITAAILAGLLLILAGCYTPSPLYGTWQEGSGTTTFVFSPDGSFSMSIKSTAETSTDTGTWQTIDNVLILRFDEKSYMFEWEIRGAILHLTLDEDNNYTLFHVSK